MANPNPVWRCLVTKRGGPRRLIRTRPRFCADRRHLISLYFTLFYFISPICLFVLAVCLHLFTYCAAVLESPHPSVQLLLNSSGWLHCASSPPHCSCISGNALNASTAFSRHSRPISARQLISFNLNVSPPASSSPPYLPACLHLSRPNTSVSAF